MLNKTSHTLITLSSAALLAAQLGVATAQTMPQNAPHHAQLPATKNERGEHMRARWQQADLDNDGQLSKAEAQAAGMKHLSDKFDVIDSNKDGKISGAEFRSWMQAKRAEKHGGKQALSAPAGQAATAPFGKAPLPAQGGGMDYKTPEQRQAAMKERLAKADTNKDGGLSKAEAQAANMNRLVDNFDAVDTNKDGKITPEEMRATWERRKQ